VRDPSPHGYFHVTVDTEVAPAVVRAVGELDASSSDDLLRAIDAAVATGHGLVLELADVTFIDSSGLRVVTIGVRQARDAGYRFTIASASDAVRRIFDMTGVGHLIGP
jgi:anti-anti-sigma factor